jgi:hypothetical protein
MIGETRAPVYRERRQSVAPAADFAVDPIILGELRFGILLLPKGKKRTSLEP